MRNYKLVKLLAVISFFVCANAPPIAAQERLSLLAGHVDWASPSLPVTFSFTLNRRPDFFTADQLGRQHEAFYVGIYDAGSSLPTVPSVPSASFIFGDDIYRNGEVSIKSGDGDFTVLDRVPFSLTEETITFSVLPSLLDVQEPFGVVLQLNDDFGKWSPPAYFGTAGGGNMVPEPNTVTLLLLAFLCIGHGVRNADVNVRPSIV